MKATAQEMHDARLDIAFRDYCAHLLIPLNKCRHETYFAPWKCSDERHTYEKCQYRECVRRVWCRRAAATSAAAAVAARTRARAAGPAGPMTGGALGPGAARSHPGGGTVRPAQ